MPRCSYVGRGIDSPGSDRIASVTAASSAGVRPRRSAPDRSQRRPRGTGGVAAGRCEQEAAAAPQLPAVHVAHGGVQQRRAPVRSVLGRPTSSKASTSSTWRPTTSPPAARWRRLCPCSGPPSRNGLASLASSNGSPATRGISNSRQPSRTVHGEGAGRASAQSGASDPDGRIAPAAAVPQAPQEGRRRRDRGRAACGTGWSRHPLL